MTVSAEYAETTVADLLSAADNGEEVVIARPGKPALRFVADTISTPATSSTPEAPKERKPRILGAGRGGCVSHPRKNGLRWIARLRRR